MPQSPMRTEFLPPVLIRNQHLQSALGVSPWRRRRVAGRARGFLASSAGEIVDCGAGVRLLALHTPPPEPGPAPVLILLHGWEGSADSLYMISAGTRLWRDGYRVIRLNMRDHGGSEQLNPDIFHSCRLAEMIGAVAAIQRRFPAAPLYLAGYSLGGNFALRIAAAAGPAGLRLAGVTAVCPVLDPAQTMVALDRGFFGYRQYFLRKWRRSLARKAQAFPGRYDFGDLARFTRLEPMTGYFVTRYTEYPDLASYLRGYALTGDRLAGIDVPTHVLLAEDDPVIPVQGLGQVRLPDPVRVLRSRFGGHCGFLLDYRGNTWLDEFVRATCGATHGPAPAE